MPKQSPIPDELDRPFWAACNEGRLVIQHCTRCDRLQHPPEPTCAQCGSADNLEWRQVSGRGRIYSYAVMYDTPVTVLQADQPFNIVVITLEEDPGIQMLSHLPGTTVDQVPWGASVQVEFETTPNGQKVPEWRVVG
ncbi:MAG: OB-fold domain-containing protein [Chloroflexi bacterium]|nr:OB-fold domain-containing protein [Chloroflexota bacterium]